LLSATALAAQSSSAAEGRTFWDNLSRNGEVTFNKNASKLLQYAVIDRKPMLSGHRKAVSLQNRFRSGIVIRQEL
jgi:hypothetical protein